MIFKILLFSKLTEWWIPKLFKRQSSVPPRFCCSYFLNVNTMVFDKFLTLLLKIEAERTLLSMTCSIVVLFPFMFCNCPSVKNRDGSVKQNKYKVLGVSMNVFLDMLTTVNVSEIISARLFSVVMLTETLPSLRIATKNTPSISKSLLILKAIFGSSVGRFLRLKVLFVWFAEIEITSFKRLSKACEILDDDDCWISAEQNPSSSVVEFSKSWSTTARMLFSTCVNTKKLLELSFERCYQLKRRGHLFIASAKFSGKLTFLNSWYTHVRMRIRG